MLQVSSSVLIDASLEKVFGLLSRPEQLAGKMDSVKSFEIISRGADSVLAQTTAGANGRDTSFTLELRFSPPDRIDFHQIKGELRSLDGEDLLAFDGDATRVTETIRFDMGIPLFGDLLGKMGIEPLIQQQVEERLAVLKEIAEGEAG